MINSLMATGEHALMNAQVGIAVTSDNIANVDTEGYARRTVHYATTPSISKHGQTFGTGAEVEEVRRNYDALLESSFLAASSDAAKWEAEAATLYGVETLFAQGGDEYGVSTALNTYLNSLTALEEAAADDAVRQELINYSEALTDSLRSVDAALQDEVEAVNGQLQDGVADANALMAQIAQLNNDIVAHPEDLELRDQRDLATRELATLVDVQVIAHANDQVTVLTTSGQPLVEGDIAYELTWEDPQVLTDLTGDSNFDGALYFEGQSSAELLVEFTASGPTDASSGAATFRVSLDGGATWVTDDTGAIQQFTAGGYDDRVEVAGVEIYFGQSDDPNALPTTDIAAGNAFEVMPKSGLYWNDTTSGKVNITPLDDATGAARGSDRLSGGELAGLLEARDQGLSAYQEELDALAEQLIWETNFQHSQGAGLEHYDVTTATNSVGNTSLPLAQSDLAYADRLQAGGLAFAFYDADTGDAQGVSALDFSSVTPGTPNFDPEQHSLDDVATAINASFPGQLQASISDGRLHLDAADGVEFEFAGDSSGLLAALGLNTYFAGHDVQTMAMDPRVAADTNRINAATVDATGHVSSGDNSNALALAAIAEKDVSLDSRHASGAQTFTEHLHALTGKVGGDTDLAARNYTQSATLRDTLAERQEAVAGVSMDEELAQLTRYQQAYEAASTLIRTAGEMFDTIMSMKP